MMKGIFIFILFFIYCASGEVLSETVEVNSWYLNQNTSSNVVYNVPLDSADKISGRLFQAYAVLEGIEEGKYFCVSAFKPEQVVQEQDYFCQSSAGENVFACLGNLNLAVWATLPDIDVTVCCSTSNDSCSGSCSSGAIYDIYFSYFNGNNATTECANNIPQLPLDSSSPSPMPSPTSTTDNSGSTDGWVWFLILFGVIFVLCCILGILGAIALAIVYYLYKKRATYAEL